LPPCGFVFAVWAIIFTTGCSTMDGLSKKPEAEGSSMEQSAELEPAQQIAQLQSREKELKREIRSLSEQLKAEKFARDSLSKRLDIAQAAREEAIREVVRIRARMQGMASQAEASAMFAEARVIIDRMEEEAFNVQALQDLHLARSYMARAKGALGSGNPGGAAYLFDLIPGLYESMKKTDPRTVKVNVKIASLRESPAPSARKIASLYWGESAIGLEKKGDWIKVRSSSGQAGWIRWSQTQ
jgi:hypothetical protein